MYLSMLSSDFIYQYQYIIQYAFKATKSTKCFHNHRQTTVSGGKEIREYKTIIWQQNSKKFAEKTLLQTEALVWTNLNGRMDALAHAHTINCHGDTYVLLITSWFEKNQNLCIMLRTMQTITELKPTLCRFQQAVFVKH